MSASYFFQVAYYGAEVEDKDVFGRQLLTLPDFAQDVLHSHLQRIISNA
jgi:hypothetical protein